MKKITDNKYKVGGGTIVLNDVLRVKMRQKVLVKTLF